MLRRLAPVSAAAVALVAASAVPAFAAPVTTVNHTHLNTYTFVDVVPTCTVGEDAPLYVITATTNSVEKETVKDDGTYHGTFTETGKFTAVPQDDASLPSYDGRYTVWGGFNQNSDVKAGSTFTFSINATGSDGSDLKVNQVEHFNTTPDNVVQEFFKCH